MKASNAGKSMWNGRMLKVISLAMLVSIVLTIPASAAPPPQTPQQEDSTTWMPVIGGASDGPEAYAQDVLREADGFAVIPPDAELAAAIAEFKQADPDASFSFFNGHVSNFATRPKATIPGYAQATLTSLGLPTTPQEPELLPDPAETAKMVQNLDSDPSVQFPWALEVGPTSSQPPTDTNDISDTVPGPDVPIELRVNKPLILEPRDDSWKQPSDRVVDIYNRAALPIFQAFLAENLRVFQARVVTPQVGAADATGASDSLVLVEEDFKSGRFYHLAKYSMYYGDYPVLSTPVSVLYDINWNVVGISKLLVTTEKVVVDLTVGVTEERALEIAIAAASELTGPPESPWVVESFELGVDLMRRHLVYVAHLYIPSAAENDVTVQIDARTGAVLNVTNNVDEFVIDGANGETFAIAYIIPHEHAAGTVMLPEVMAFPMTAMQTLLYNAAQRNANTELMATGLGVEQGEMPDSMPDAVDYTDAKVRRWAYENGDVRQPYQVVTNNMYVRDDNTLAHDFFLSVNEQRSSIDTDDFDLCGDQNNKTTWPSDAWDGFGSETWIRPTVRNDRNFSLWSPAEVSGTFSESHNYFWSRAFFQWLKPALAELGVLPSSAGNYPKVLMIVNACIDDIGYANSASLEVSTKDNVGENLRKIRIADACRQGSGLCAVTDYDFGSGGHYSSCDGLACMATPSIIHHEINHHIMAQFFGIGSGLDCNTSDQRRFLHEGTLGSVIPQAFWHSYYGVGYAPSDTDRLFTMDEVRGSVHVNNASLLQISDRLCVNNTTTSAANKGPYNAGRVPGQALWKMYHGLTVNGTTFGNTWRPSTDTDFNILVYWAADLVADSDYMDRYEMANRVMEILDKHSNWSSSAKQTYCGIWAQHELDNYINDDYCS